MKVDLFSDLSWLICVDHQGQPPIPTCISEPWLPVTLSVLHPHRQTLTTADWEHWSRAAGLEMLSPSHPSILSNSLKPF